MSKAADSRQTGITDNVSWLDTTLAMLEDVEVVIHASVIQVQGSAPRAVGANMLITTDTIWDTIGGGALEFEVMKQARRDIAKIKLSPVKWHRRVVDIALGPDMGQCCGGHVRVLIEAFTIAEMPDLRILVDSDQTVLHPLKTGLPLQLADADLIDDGATIIDDKTSFLLPHKSYQRPLFIYGAGHVGRALVSIIAGLGFDVYWVDISPDRFPADVPNWVSEVIAIDPTLIAAHAPIDAFHLVITHSHALDQAICHTVLAGEGFARLGLIGSKTKNARFRSRLGKAGITDDVLARLTCPIGIDLVTGKQPARVAISIVAQLAIWQQELDNKRVFS
ncbi:xanthine dehydrogenase accessory protein XdhC [Alphaproteobacteria bacterium]|nr:xanthine dehydrogenase accessory protein XdhC [Alphaproteobacteria bacterium]